MKHAATVIYVDSVAAILDFHRRAFGREPGLVDLDVQLPGREAGRLYPWGQAVAYVRSVEGTFVGICSPI